MGDSKGASMGPGEGEERSGVGRRLRSHSKGSTTPPGQWESREGFNHKRAMWFLPIKRMTPQLPYGENQRIRDKRP